MVVLDLRAVQQEMFCFPRHLLAIALLVLPVSLLVLTAACAKNSPAVSDPDGAATADGAGETSADTAEDTAADATTTRADLAWPVDQPGPYHVGYRTLPLTYVPAPDGVTRTIQLSLWYPTDDKTGTPAVYSPAWPVPHEDVFQDAKLAPPADPSGYPVHAFTHGHLGFAGSAPYMVRHFASHGWLVIAPDHTGNTLANANDPKPPQIYWWREKDMEAAIDWLQNLPKDDPLHQKARTEKIFLSGHSFGSTDTWALAGVPYEVDTVKAHCDAVDCTPQAIALYQAGFTDTRVVAAAQLAGGVDGGVFALGAPKFVHIPLMVMNATGDVQHPAGPLWEPLQHGWHVEIAGGCHQTFGLGVCDPPVTEDVGPPIVWTYTLALARNVVLGDSGAQVLGILDGSVQVSSYATLQKK